MIRERADFDADVAESSALTLRDHARSIPALFPEGSDEDPSEARSLIWEDWEAFLEIAGDLEDSAADLAARARGASDAVAIKAEFGAVTRTCKSCHEVFRLAN